MKITKIRILLIVAVFFVPSFTNAGCFTRNDIKFKITKSPNVKCLDVSIYKTCLGGIELEIENNCSEEFIYKDKNGIKIRTGKTFVDPNIPDDYGYWERELYNEKNDDKITISVQNLKVNSVVAVFLEAPFFFVLIIVALIFTLAGVANIIKTSLRNRKRKKIAKNIQLKKKEENEMKED